MVLDFARSGSLRTTGSWFHRPDSRRWNWYSNSNDAWKKIDHVSGRCRLQGISERRVSQNRAQVSPSHPGNTGQVLEDCTMQPKSVGCPGTRAMPKCTNGKLRKVSAIHQRHEQSGFTPKKSRVDRIMAIRVLT